MATDVIAVLNDLTEASKDGEREYHKAAEATLDRQLKLLFSSRANDCTRAARELQDLVRGLGGKPENHGSMSGALHRGWLGMKTLVSGRSDEAILAECERGEDSAEQHYRMALGADLPADVRQVVERQYRSVRENQERIRALHSQHMPH
ncbi:PA2169 family four-helix-bundle protein [Trinickia terrae]|uniref:PA2169 family four-helix-bundle protein n=1 Tax=Trinickia terrae TaxID=2571161 RepID=A0A4U1HRT8_9BURK|nr:PA2169 family four-helix-bundle protein [Trinickia terrae]TKC83083.1 PA2169 family four-helix-bundle protein [Trinickia terrae]